MATHVVTLPDPAWVQELCNALGLEMTSLTRIIVDIQVNQPIRVYTGGFADKKILTLEPPKIEWVEKETDDKR